MLKLILQPEEYLTIGGDIVVQLWRATWNRADLLIEAPRDVSILRGEVLERNGGERPACLVPLSEKKRGGPQSFPWNDDREQAAQIMRKVFDQLDRKGASEEAAVLREQLERIVPYFKKDTAQ